MNQSIIHDGHNYMLKYCGLKAKLYYYQHAHCKKDQICQAKLKVFCDGIVKVIGEHADFCKEKNGIELDKLINDFTDEMNEMAEDLATKNYELKPKEIWKIMTASMNN